jgi:hypothetical protein
MTVCTEIGLYVSVYVAPCSFVAVFILECPKYIERINEENVLDNDCDVARVP